MPDEVKSQMKFEFVEKASEVLKHALDLEVTPLTRELPGSPVAPLATA